MLTLYYKPSCPFSQSVLAAAEELQIKLRLKDISIDDVLVDELMQAGGKKQTPYLLDPEKGEGMYESEAIISYLAANYGGGSQDQSFSGLRIHRSEESCDSCQ